MLTPDLLQHWNAETDHELITWLRLDCADSRVNLLSQAVLRELDMILDEVIAERPRGVVIMSGKPGGFIAGANIGEFVGLDRPGAEVLMRSAHQIMNKLDKLPMPVVAIIDGFCLGGGLELALACDYRLATVSASTRFAFPEIKLGIHPAFGGTARAIRVLGAMKALRMMLDGEAMDAAVALRHGLVHRLGTAPRLRDLAHRYIHDQDGAPGSAWPWPKMAEFAWVRRLQTAWLASRAGEVREEMQRYPAAGRLLRLWREHGDNPRDMLAGEIESAAELLAGDTAQNLVYQHFCQTRLRKACPLDESSKQALRTVGVAGLDRQSIALAAQCLMREMRVNIYDASPGKTAIACRHIRGLLRRRLGDSAARKNALRKLTVIPPWKVSAPPEVMILSGHLSGDDLALLAPGVRDGGLLLTVDQEVTLDDFAKRLNKPGHLVALHLDGEFDRGGLVEVMYNRFTAKKWCQQACRFAHTLGALPLPVGKSPGFLINRLLLPYLFEVLRLRREGMTQPAVVGVTRSLGMPRNPFHIIDELGMPTLLHLAEELGVAADLPGEPESEARGSGRSSMMRHEIVCDRLLLPLLNAAVSCLRKGVVDDMRVLDAAAVSARVFPRFEGGPMRYILRHDAESLLQRLRSLESRYGGRFSPDKGWEKPELFQLPVRRTKSANRPLKFVNATRNVKHNLAPLQDLD